MGQNFTFCFAYQLISHLNTLTAENRKISLWLLWREVILQYVLHSLP